jgi:tRNA (guanine-N7-)-methyltransferase
VEVGFGKDEFLLCLAEARPDLDFLAIDYSRPRARSYLRKIERRRLTNVRVLVEHAMVAVSLCLADASVREFFVLFSDPWPKKRHASHRIVAPWFAREAARTLLPGGKVTLATDHAPYRDEILAVLQSEPRLRNLLGPGGSGPRPAEYPETIFERRWLGKGKVVWYMQFAREGGP